MEGMVPLSLNFVPKASDLLRPLLRRSFGAFFISLIFFFQRHIALTAFWEKKVEGKSTKINHQLVTVGQPFLSISCLNPIVNTMTIPFPPIPPIIIFTRPPPESIISQYKTYNISVEFFVGVKKLHSYIIEVGIDLHCDNMSSKAIQYFRNIH